MVYRVFRNACLLTTPMEQTVGRIKQSSVLSIFLFNLIVDIKINLEELIAKKTGAVAIDFISQQELSIIKVKELKDFPLPICVAVSPFIMPPTFG